MKYGDAAAPPFHRSSLIALFWPCHQSAIINPKSPFHHSAFPPMTQLPLTLLLLAGCAAAQPTHVVPTDGRKPVEVVVRVDDVFMYESPLKPASILPLADLCEKHGAKLTLLVIPHRLLQSVNADGTMSAELIRLADRGHEIAQHGFDHRDARDGSTGREYDSPTFGIASYAVQSAEIPLGKKLLEAVVGRPVLLYSGAGTDYHDSVTVRVLREAGFRYIGHSDLPMPYRDKGFINVPIADDYTWALTDSLYAPMLDSAKARFRQDADRYGYASIFAHDHFTRTAYRDGITLRFIDELLTWIDRQPGYRVTYVTQSEAGRRAETDPATPTLRPPYLYPR